MWPKRPASVVIVSATYLLVISLPNIDNIAMSLYDIIVYYVWRKEYQKRGAVHWHMLL